MGIKRSLFLQKMRCFKRGSLAFARELEQNCSLSADSLAALNLERRRDLTLFAFSRIPLYRKKFNSVGFEPGDVEAENFFDHLPILEKDEIRNCSDQLIDPKSQFEDLIESTTGGTTGAPLRTYGDPDVPLNVLSWRTLNWWGVDVSDSSGYLYRAVPEGRGRFLQKAALWPTKRNWISAAEMTPSNMGAFFRSLQHDRAVYLVGYVGAIDVFASYLADEGGHLDSLKAVWTTSSPLPEGKRRFLQKILRCPVYSQYGSCEFYWIASECGQQNGLHIASDIRHVDVVRGNRPTAIGGYGDLVVTDLLNKKFPLIRYRLGDRGRLLERRCKCCLPFPMMDYVKGRITDAIITPSGNTIPGEYWTTICDDFTSEVKSFQVHQAKDLSVTIKYEPHRGADCSAAINTIRSRLMQKLGPGGTLVFSEERIAVNDNGKTRFVISEAD